MNDKIVMINHGGKPYNPEPVPDQRVIEMLEKMLAHAQSGYLQAFFGVGWNSDNSITSGWMGSEKAAFTLIGGVAECMNEYMLKEFERRK